MDIDDERGGQVDGNELACRQSFGCDLKRRLDAIGEKIAADIYMTCRFEKRNDFWLLKVG